MEGSIILFLLGTAASSTLVAGLIWPISRLLYYLVAPSRAVWFALITTVFAIAILVTTTLAIMLLYQGYFATPQTRLYGSYTFLTSSFMTMFGLCLFIGPVTYYWLYYYRIARPTTVDKRNHFTLTLALCVITALALISPFLNRWLSNVTSLEISQIGKITIDAKQPASSQSPPFITSLSATPAGAEYRGFELVSALVQLQDFGDMITRDLAYDGLLRRNRDNAENETAIVKALTSDYQFLLLLQPVAACLELYARQFRDYRLFLVDIKKVIHLMTILAKDHDPTLSRDHLNNLRKEAQQLTEDAKTALNKLSSKVIDKDEVKKRCEVNWANWTDDIEIDSSNLMPYKTLALAYLLWAIGAADTGIVEVAGWLDSNKVQAVNWYNIRASIEVLLLLESILPGGQKHRSYKDFLSRKLHDLANTMPSINLKKWMEDCPSLRQERNLNEVNLYFTYITQLNAYVKGVSNLDEINEQIVQIAQTNKDINYQCFKQLDDVFPDRNAWHAEFLTNYAITLLVTSHDERLFGRSEHPERQRLRASASRDLLHAIQLLEPVVRQNRSILSQQPEANRIFSRPRWEDTLQTAKEARRSILDVEK